MSAMRVLSLRGGLAALLAVAVVNTTAEAEVRAGAEPVDGAGRPAVLSQEPEDGAGFDQLWSPIDLFYDQETILRPTWYRELRLPGLRYGPPATAEPEGAELLRDSALPDGVPRWLLVTGLAGTPAKDVVVCAVVSPDTSQLLEIRPPGGATRVLAEAGILGQQVWFREPMSLSPDGRWLLVSTSNREGGFSAEVMTQVTSANSIAGDLWLLDCVGAAPPRLVCPDARLVSCTWAPSGQHAICQQQRGGAALPSTVLLEAETGEVRELLQGECLAVWSEDSSKVQLFAPAPTGPLVLTYDLRSHSVESRAAMGMPPAWGEGVVWSSCLERGAYVPAASAGTQVVVRGLWGGKREVNVAGGIRQLLGWSWGGRLLGYVTRDGHLEFASGVLDDDDYNKWIDALPLVPSDPTEALGLETKRSPVQVSSRHRVLAAWTTCREGPCLVYADGTSEADQKLAFIGWTALSASRDFGLDPRADLREQVIRQKAESDLYQFWSALAGYAADHEGKLPVCETGPELLSALQDYLDPSILRPAYSPGRIAMRLLAPGEDFNALRSRDLPERRQLKIAEMESDEGFVFVLFADQHIEQVEPFPRLLPSPWDGQAPGR